MKVIAPYTLASEPMDGYDCRIDSGVSPAEGVNDYVKADPGARHVIVAPLPEFNVFVCRQTGQGKKSAPIFRLTRFAARRLCLQHETSAAANC
jgi:hypothetical protein